MNHTLSISLMIFVFIFLNIPSVKGTNSEAQENFLSEKINVRFSLKDGHYEAHTFFDERKGKVYEFNSWEEFINYLNEDPPLISADLDLFYINIHYLTHFLQSNKQLKKLILRGAGEWSHQKPLVWKYTFPNIENLRVKDNNCLRTSSNIFLSFPNLTYLDISEFLFFDHAKLNQLTKLEALKINNLREGNLFLPVLNNLKKITESLHI